MHRKVVVYIACSLDGYIATEDGNLDWLTSVAQPGEDYGYSDFIKTVDTVILGRKTYDKVLSFGIEFPHKDRKCYVISRTRTGSDDNVTFYNGDIPELIATLKQQEGNADIFVDGGAEVIFELMKHNLVDRFVISTIPALLGSGITLFRSGRPEQCLKLIRSTTFPSGLVQLWYDKRS